MDVVLVEPSIAPNTGAIIRLCANTGTALHLVRPLGFELDEKNLRRGGLDYHDLTTTTVHDDLASARAALPGRWWLFTARATELHTSVTYSHGDAVVFGNEKWGLPDALRDEVPAEQHLTIPMMAGNRSLNLANAVSVVVYEAWRQVGFDPNGPGA